jgi:hypothetical protein
MMLNNVMPDKDEELYLEEIGTVVFQNALMRYLASVEPLAVKEFETYVSEHAEKNDFIETLCTAYPEFAVILAEEASSLQAELQEVTKVVDRDQTS